MVGPFVLSAGAGVVPAPAGCQRVMIPAMIWSTESAETVIAHGMQTSVRVWRMSSWSRIVTT